MVLDVFQVSLDEIYRSVTANEADISVGPNQEEGTTFTAVGTERMALIICQVSIVSNCF